MTVTELGRFNLAAIRRDELVDALKLFSLILPLDIASVSYHANHAMWKRIMTALEAREFTGQLFGCVATADPRYEDDIVAVVCKHRGNEYVLTLAYPKETQS